MPTACTAPRWCGGSRSRTWRCRALRTATRAISSRSKAYARVTSRCLRRAAGAAPASRSSTSPRSPTTRRSAPSSRRPPSGLAGPFARRRAAASRSNGRAGLGDAPQPSGPRAAVGRVGAGRTLRRGGAAGRGARAGRLPPQPPRRQRGGAALRGADAVRRSASPGAQPLLARGQRGPARRAARVGSAPRRRTVRLVGAPRLPRPGGRVRDRAADGQPAGNAHVDTPAHAHPHGGGVRPLAGMEAFAALERLRLVMLTVTDLAPLAELPALRRVVAFGEVSDAVAALRRARPDIDVTWHGDGAPPGERVGAEFLRPPLDGMPRWWIREDLTALFGVSTNAAAEARLRAALASEDRALLARLSFDTEADAVHVDGEREDDLRAVARAIGRLARAGADAAR